MEWFSCTPGATYHFNQLVLNRQLTWEQAVFYEQCSALPETQAQCDCKKKKKKNQQEKWLRGTCTRSQAIRSPPLRTWGNWITPVSTRHSWFRSTRDNRYSRTGASFSGSTVGGKYSGICDSPWSQPKIELHAAWRLAEPCFDCHYGNGQSLTHGYRSKGIWSMKHSYNLSPLGELVWRSGRREKRKTNT